MFTAYVCTSYLEAVRAPAAQPEAHGDGIGYYAHLRSAVFDGDLSYANDYALLGRDEPINPATGLAVNVFPVGPALFWLPFVPAAYVVQRYVEPPSAGSSISGTESPFQRTVFFGSAVAGLFATALGMLAGRRVTAPLTAALASIGVAAGSPLIWYMLRQPSYAHAVDACVSALFAAVWLATFGSQTRSRWLGLGALLGLAMLTRPQNACHVLLPLAEWLRFAAQLWFARERRNLARWTLTGTIFVLGAISAFTPLLLLWRHLNGSWTLLPQGPDFMMWKDSRWDATLFSSRNGLFAWHPLLLVSTAGLIALSTLPRFGRAMRLLGLSALAIIAVQAYVNGAARDWWGGWAFGGRRFLSCTFYFMLGLAAVLDVAHAAVQRHPRIAAWVASAALLVGVAAYNRALSDDYVTGRALPDRPQPFAPRYTQALQREVGNLYAWAGNPGSWPANLWFAARANVSPARYDVASAEDIFADELRQGRVVPFDDAHAMGGFEPAENWDGRAGRITRGPTATWTFVLRRRIGVRGVVTLASSKAGTRVRMRLRGEVIFDATLTPSWTDYPLNIPGSLTRAGNNFVEVEQTPLTYHGLVRWDKAFLEASR